MAAQVLSPLAGTELVINLSLTIASLHMDEYDFYADFSAGGPGSRVCRVAKAAMTRVDADNFLAVVDTTGMKPGLLEIEATALIPDTRCPDNIRKEVGKIVTNILLY